MGEFQDRMKRDLEIRGFALSTQQCYLARMKAMIRFFMRPPDELTIEDIHSYQLHLTRVEKVCWGSFNQSVCAIRFFYGVTLDKGRDIQRIPYQKTGRKLPVVLSCEEVSKLFDVVENLKHRTILGRLCRRTARVGGYPPARERHRQPAHDVARRAGQGTPGSLRHAFAQVAHRTT